jgi:hypothetical protein
MGREGHPEVVLAIDEHIARAREFDTINLCKEFLSAVKNRCVCSSIDAVTIGDT